MRFTLRLIASVFMLFGIFTACLLTASLFNSDIAHAVGSTVEAVTQAVMAQADAINTQAAAAEVG